MHSEPFKSKTSWDSCKKNPGHENFIPIHNFTRDLLPERYRSDIIYNLICLMADLTVCLRVKSVSNNRPSEYVFSKFRGKNTTHTGTGVVCHVGDTKDVSTLCDCPECEDQAGVFTSAKLEDVCSHTEGTITTLRTEVFIRTAAHVVFDNDEAKSTFIDVFFDDENDRQNSRLLRGYCLSSADVENDISVIKCVTHDQAISDRLRNSLVSYEKLQSKASSSFGEPAKFIESNLQGRATIAVKIQHLHLKSKTSKPLTVTDKSVEWKPIAVCDKSVTSQPIASSGKYVESQLHQSSSEVTLGSETVDLLHKCHCYRSGSNLIVTDDDDNNKSLKKFFAMTDIVRSVKRKDNMKADNSEEAELDNLEVSVHYPDGEISLHNIWLFEEKVRKSKEFLLIQGGIKNVSPDLLVMVIKCSDTPDIIMSDDLDMRLYLEELTQAEYIEITWKDNVE